LYGFTDEEGNVHVNIELIYTTSKSTSRFIQKFSTVYQHELLHSIIQDIIEDLLIELPKNKHKSFQGDYKFYEEKYVRKLTGEVFDKKTIRMYKNSV